MRRHGMRRHGMRCGWHGRHARQRVPAGSAGLSKVQVFGLEPHAAGGCDFNAPMLDIHRALEDDDVKDALCSMDLSEVVQGRFGLDDSTISVVELRRRRRQDRCDRSLSWPRDARMRSRLVALDLALYGEFSP